jgi:hypothetical protein
MALIDSLSFVQNADIDTGVVTDTSDYSVGGNPPRSATANYLLWSKTNMHGVRTFTNPDQGNVFSTLTYTVSTLIDGYYEGIRMRFDPYSGATNYVEQQSSGSVVTQYASVVYHDGAIYKAIAPGTGNLPTDTNFWEVVLDLSTLITNSNVDVFIEEFYIKVRASQCANDKLAENCGCGCNGDLSKIQPALLVSAKIMSADAAFANDNPEQMEKIIRDIEETCANC